MTVKEQREGVPPKLHASSEGRPLRVLCGFSPYSLVDSVGRWYVARIDHHNDKVGGEMGEYRPIQLLVV